MAEELYREWFVRLRFPGHEKVNIYKGVPEGWEVKKIKEIVNRKPFGRIYRENELDIEGKTIVIDQSIKDYLGFYDGVPEHDASKDKPTILFGDHSCKMQLMIEPFSLAENVIPFTGKGKMPTVFLFFLIHNSIETTEYKRHWTELTNKGVYVPPLTLQEEFSVKATNHIVYKSQLKTLNRKVESVRDRLLSRLMSGKIDVENLDIRFPESMKEEAGHA
jgi:type I restriction enzyme S subunit